MTDTAATHAYGDPAGSDSPDEALVAAVRGGDDQAFALLFERYQRRIAAFVQGLVADHGRAEDVSQEVFLSALRRMRETDRPIAFKPWIYEIARNATIDEFRRSKRTREVSFEATGESTDAPAAGGFLAPRPQSPDAAVHQKQTLQHLFGAFDELSDTHHAVLVLRELEGLSYREIGERLNLSQPAVEGALFRARRRLTEEFDQLASGESCVRTQSLIASAAQGLLGARELHRVAQHVSYCEVCRQHARLARMDSAVVSRPKRRRSIAERIGGLLPLPASLRKRRGADAEALFWVPGGARAAGLVARFGMAAPASEPAATGWGKAAAAATTLVLAGVGTGMSSHITGSTSAKLPEPLVARASADPAPKRASAQSGGSGAASPASGLVDPRGRSGAGGAGAPDGGGGSGAPASTGTGPGPGPGPSTGTPSAGGFPLAPARGGAGSVVPSGRPPERTVVNGGGEGPETTGPSRSVVVGGTGTLPPHPEPSEGPRPVAPTGSGSPITVTLPVVEGAPVPDPAVVPVAAPEPALPALTTPDPVQPLTGLLGNTVEPAATVAAGVVGPLPGTVVTAPSVDTPAVPDVQAVPAVAVPAVSTVPAVGVPAVPAVPAVPVPVIPVIEPQTVLPGAPAPMPGLPTQGPVTVPEVAVPDTATPVVTTPTVVAPDVVAVPAKPVVAPPAVAAPEVTVPEVSAPEVAPTPAAPEVTVPDTTTPAVTAPP